LFRSIRGEYAAKEFKNRAWRICDGVEHFGFGGEGRVKKQPGREANLILFSIVNPADSGTT
jgi:hypothetical protein